MSKRVLVTGASGSLGSYLSKMLCNKGYNVRALVRKTSRLDLLENYTEKLELFEGNILDLPSLEDAIKDIDWVFHCAAKVSYSPKGKKEMIAINIEGTANVVHVCQYHNTPKLIHASSIAALGREGNKKMISEKDLYKPDDANSLYSKTKFKAEQEVWRGAAEGLNIAIVNPSVILGTGFWENSSNRIFQKVAKGLRFYTTGSTGFVDVRDVAQAMILCAEKDIRDKRFVINGANIKYQYLFNQIADGLNVKQPTIKVTPLLSEIAWRVEKIKGKIIGKTPLVTKETAHIASQSFSFDNSLSINELGMAYRPIEETIQQCCEAYLEYQKSGKHAYLQLN